MGDQITASKLRLQWGMLFMLIFYMAFHVSMFGIDFIEESIILQKNW